MPSWGILKSSKKKHRSAHKVHFMAGGEQDQVNRDRSSSLESDASDQPLQERLRQDSLTLGHYHHHRHHHLDLSHEDVEDEEEKLCLRHLDHLGLALENTFKEVETLDAYVKQLRYNFDHEAVPEKRFMSCMCSAKLARAACCKKQIEVWQQLQHDIQEMSCHHHSHTHEAQAVGHHCEMSMLDCHDQASDSDSSSISTTCSHDTADSDFIVSQLNKMVLFDVIRQRLDPVTDSKTFVEHWILNVHHSTHSDSNTHGSDSHTLEVRL